MLYVERACARLILTAMPQVRRVTLSAGTGELPVVALVGGGGIYTVRYAKA